MNVFTRMFSLTARNALACELYIHDIHKSYPQYSYDQLLKACRELCVRQPDAAIDTLEYLYQSCMSGRPTTYTTQLEQIIREQQEQEN